MISDKEYWNNIYFVKKSEELSWTEENPEISLDLIKQFELPKTASIIDIGGGESKLADFLLELGYENITVSDISEISLDRAKKRLGKNSDRIHWTVGDVTDFESNQVFDCWHDRAAFHFLTSPEAISKYASLAGQYIKPNGYLIIGTFSENGPEKCSGLAIRRYSQDELSSIFSDGFKKKKCLTHDHITPFNTKQNFIYCSFQRV